MGLVGTYKNHHYILKYAKIDYYIPEENPMKPAYLEKELPQFSSIDEAIFYNKKKYFLQILNYPKVLENKKEVLQDLENNWNNLEKKVQQEIISDYKNSKTFSTFSNLMIDSSLKSMASSADLLRFLFKKGFELSKKDLKNFESNNWLEYKDIEIGNAHVYEHNLAMPFLMLFDTVVDMFKNLLRIKTPSGMYIIEYYSQNLIPVLIDYRDKLPPKLYSKLLRELSEEKLEELGLKNFNFSSLNKNQK